MEFREHLNTVLPLCGRYLRGHEVSAAEAVEKLIPETQNWQYSGKVSPFDVQGALGIEYAVMALYYVEEHFRPTTASDYAMKAEFNLGAYTEINRDKLSAQDLRSHEIWRDNAAVIRAYCALHQDEFQQTLDILGRVQATVISSALAGCALTRMAYEVNPDYAYPAYEMLRRMDETGVKGPFSWTHEEDIFRQAYGYLTLLLDDAQRSFPGEHRIPHDLPRALQLSRKIYAMLSNSEQKAWAQEDIDTYTRKLYG